MTCASLSIVIVHRGNSRWLGRALRSAQVTNSSAKIVLIGDCAGAKLANDLGVEFSSWVEYSENADELDNAYVHRSTHGRDFELVCLQRWLVLESWMKANRREEVVAMDSDILVFADFEQVLMDVPNKGVGFVHDSAHVALIPTAKDLSVVCQVIRDAYADPEYRLVDRMHRSHLLRSDQGGVSDMSFFRHLASNDSGMVHDIRGPHGHQKWSLDVTMNDGIGGFAVEDGVKKIRWIEGVPHGFHQETDSWRPFATLHFQGKAKSLMPKYFHKVRRFDSRAVRSNDRKILRERVCRRVRKLICRDD